MQHGLCSYLDVLKQLCHLEDPQVAWELIGGIHFHTVAHIDLHEFGGVLDLFELDGLEVCYSDWVTILPLGKNLHP